MEVPEPSTDELLRTAVKQKRLIQFVYRDKPRIVEPHDYGIHKGRVKLFGYQVGGLSPVAGMPVISMSPVVEVTSELSSSMRTPELLSSPLPPRPIRVMAPAPDEETTPPTEH